VQEHDGQAGLIDEAREVGAFTPVELDAM